MSPERREWPDIDTDIETARRSDGIRYFIDEYGSDHVCQIITYQQMKIKSCIKQIVSAYYGEHENYSEIVREMNAFTKLIPLTICDKEITYTLLEDILENTDNYDISDREFSKVKKIKKELDILIEKYPEIGIGINKLKNVITATGAHAGGVVISSKRLNSNTSLTKATGAAVLPIVQFEMADLDFYKLLKIDALGLNSLSQIHDALDLIGLPITWLDEEDYSDDKVYEFLRKGNTTDIFQMASFSATNMLKNFKVSSIDDIVAVNACNRPGPLQKLDELGGKSIVEIYSEVADCKREVEKLHPLLDPIFENTNGCLIYQEQCMSLGQIMCKYSLGNADSRIRKVVAKKKLDKIPEIKNEFIYGKKSVFNEEGKVIGTSEENSDYCIGAMPSGFEESLAIKLFAIIESMAKYAFNKSHSACYGVLAYKSAYLSLHYPVEYALGCINHTKDPDKIEETLEACRKREIKILQPNINTSDINYTIEKSNDTKAIRYGLSKIKDVGEVAIKELLEIRNIHGDFKSFDDFLFAINNDEYKAKFIKPTIKTKEKKIKDKYTKEIKIEIIETKSYPTKINKKVIVALILSGSFDELESNRHKLYNYYIFDIKKEKELTLEEQGLLSNLQGKKKLTKDEEKTLKNLKTKTIKKDEDKYVKRVRLSYEKEYLQAYLSGHPLEGLPFTNLDECFEGDKVIITGKVTFKEKKKTSNKKEYTTLVIDTKNNKDVRINLFGAVHEKHNKKITKDKVLVFEGIFSSEWNNIRCTNVKELKVKDNKELNANIKEEHIPNDSANSNDDINCNSTPLFGSIDLSEIFL